MTPRVVVLGGGLAGMGAAHALARAGARDVTIVERGGELGGLAGTFESGGRFYPLAYHHVLHRDRTLLFFLDRLGALDRVRWRRVRMLFQHDGRLWDLARPRDFLRFPMRLADKARFVRLMLRSSRKDGWDEWAGRSATELVDTWAGPGVRHALFERLTRLKFGLACDDVSAAWLGARLHQREGSAPLGYVPGANWTKVLCDGLAESLRADGVRVRLGATVRRLAPTSAGGSIGAAELDTGEELRADAFVTTVPTEVYAALVPAGAAPEVESIRYTAVVSAICATRQEVEPDFYWLNLTSLDSSACGIFRLDSLNPTIGAPGEACLNLMTHVPSRHDAFFRRGDDELIEGYSRDFERVLGAKLEPAWWRIARLPMYSPIFTRDFRNPPVRSVRFENVWFAGNYRTFPSVASTGTALRSGLEAAQALLAESGIVSTLVDEARAFRLRTMTRG
jgi:protoporphyrinogen oxidase